MNKDKYLMYAVAAVAAAGIAVWAGVPPFVLLLLVCPVMMFFMMGSMSGGMGRGDVNSHDHDADSPTQRSRPDGSHDRIDQP